MSLQPSDSEQDTVPTGAPDAGAGRARAEPEPDASYAALLDARARACVADDAGRKLPPTDVIEAEWLRAYRAGRRGMLSPEEAEDFAQEYCLKIVSAWGRWDGRSMLTYLNGVLKNALIDHRRRLATQTHHGQTKPCAFGAPDEGSDSIAEPPGHEPDPADAAMSDEERALAREHVAAVKNPTHRLILRLVLDGADVDDVIEQLGQLGVTRHDVWNARHRGLQDIRKHLQLE